MCRQMLVGNPNPSVVQRSGPRQKQAISVPRIEAELEGLNRQFRQITKNKPSFTNDDSLRRMLYLASQRIVRHWHARCQNWDMVLSQLQIMFADRAVG